MKNPVADALETAMKNKFARRNADRHLALYLRTRNGLLIWKAYMEYRQHGLPVPENILLWLDKVAGQLLVARGQEQIVAALEMTGSGGGPQAASLLRGQENARNIVEQFRDARDASVKKRAIHDIAHEVGQNFGITAENVKSRYSQWKSATPKQPAPADNSAQGLIDLFSKVKRTRKNA